MKLLGASTRFEAQGLGGFIHSFSHSVDHLLKALREGHTAALQIMLAETACDLQILACHLKKDGRHASGERSDGQQSLPRKVAKSRPKK